MPNLRRMSGREVIAVLESFGFQVLSQRGSHVKLRRTAPTGESENLTVPDHREIDTGTLCAIIRQATRYLSMDELRPHFYR